MKNLFCCPECGSKKLTVIKDEKPFSLAKAVVWSWFWGVFGILFSFISGQTNITVSTWICNDCRYKFKTPDEAILSIEKNQKSANFFITFYEILFVFIEVIICASRMIFGGVLSLITVDADTVLITLFITAIIGIFVIAITVIIGEVIRLFVNKYFNKKTEQHVENRRRIYDFHASAQRVDFEQF